MTVLSEERYRISAVSSMTEVSVHVLRQWEKHISKLKPHRDRANRRWYSPVQVDVVRRVKYLVKHEGMTLKGADRQIAREFLGEGRPRTRREVVDLLDKIEEEVRAMLELVGPA